MMIIANRIAVDFSFLNWKGLALPLVLGESPPSIPSSKDNIFINQVAAMH